MVPVTTSHQSFFCREGKFQHGAHGEISKRGSLREQVAFPIKMNDQAQERNYSRKFIKQQKLFVAVWSAVKPSEEVLLPLRQDFGTSLAELHTGKTKRARPGLAYRPAPGQVPCGPAWPLGPRAAFWRGQLGPNIEEIQNWIKLNMSENKWIGWWFISTYLNMYVEVSKFTYCSATADLHSKGHCVIVRFFFLLMVSF